MSVLPTCPVMAQGRLALGKLRQEHSGALVAAGLDEALCQFDTIMAMLATGRNPAEYLATLAEKRARDTAEEVLDRHAAVSAAGLATRP